MDNRNVKNNFIIRIENLSHSFEKGIFVLNDINFKVFENETIGIVGESGCGKTTLAKILSTIINPSKGFIIYNKIKYPNNEIKNLRSLRKDIRMIFQNPETTINPKTSIFSVLIEPLNLYEKKMNLDQKVERIKSILKSVHLFEIFDDIKNKNILQLSGGQKRRLSIARALIVQPKVLIADEPTAGLDLSLQVEIISLLKNIPVTKIIISHSFDLIKSLCDRLFVMYKGKILEEISLKKQKVVDLKHPFSLEMLEALENNLVNFENNSLQSGCHFILGCQYLKQNNNLYRHCKTQHPELFDIDEGNSHKIACYFFSNGNKF